MSKSLNGHEVISSDDVNAVEKLRKKIETLEALQVRMKAANKIIKGKKSDEGKIYLLQEECKLTETQAIAMMKPDFMGRIGFASYELTNNNANIRTAKERLARLDKQSKTEDTVKVYGDIRIENSASENRVKIFFPGKPDEKVRVELKRSGFKWAPSEGSWRTFYSNHAMYKAEQIVKALVPAPELITITYDEFFEKYKPVKNHLTGEAGYDSCLFETYGNEEQYIREYAERAPQNVWTLLTGTEKGDVLVSGWHFVNRLGYFITEVPFDYGAYIEIDMEETEEIINL